MLRRKGTLLLLIGLFAALAFSTPAWASIATTGPVAPTSVTVGQEFNVVIPLGSLGEVTTVGLTLNFAPDVLEVVQVRSNFLEELAKIIDNTAGFVRYSGVLLPGVSGSRESDPVVEVTFKAKVPGETILQAEIRADLLHLATLTTTVTVLPSDTTSPTVVSTDPANNATGVPLDKTISITFSEEVNAGPNYGGIAVVDNQGNAVATTNRIGGKVLTIDPTSNLNPNTRYTVYLPAGAVKDAAGNQLAQDYDFAFTTTAATVDTTPPTVISTDPANNATGVPLDKTISITFSEEVNAGPRYFLITLKDAQGKPVALKRSISGKVLTIDPISNLNPNTRYTVYLPAGAVKDAAGNAMAKEYTFDFTTRSAMPILLPAPVPTITFIDMVGHWAKDAVAELAYAGILSGYPDGTFRPDQPVTRLEAACMLTRALKLPPGDTAYLQLFRDAASVPDWAREDMAAAVKEGLIAGYPYGAAERILAPFKHISRVEQAVILARALERKLGALTPAPLTFGDAAKIPSWAKRALGIAVGRGIISGYPDNTFRPQRLVTRAEAASMLWRLLKQLP